MFMIGNAGIDLYFCKIRFFGASSTMPAGGYKELAAVKTCSGECDVNTLHTTYVSSMRTALTA